MSERRPRYVVWRNKAVPNACSLTDFQGLDTDWPLRAGVPFRDEPPAGLSFSMNPDRPYDTLLTDSLLNTQMLLVGSARLAERLRSLEIPEVEYLPVGILDHRGREIDEPYFIVHPIHPIDCIDLASSEPTFSRITPTLIKRVERLVVDEDRVPEARQLFRATNLPRATLLSRTLATSLLDEGFTGFDWIETASFQY